MSSLDCISTTRIGRYSSGENFGHLSGRHPIAQFMATHVECLPVNDKGTPQSTMQKRVSRIDQFPEDTLKVVDVGCSTGAATLSLYQILQDLTNKRVNVRGYDNDREALKKTLKGRAEYYTVGSLLHPLALRAALTHFDVRETTPNKDGRQGYTNGLDDSYSFSLKPSSLPLLREMLSFGEADHLPVGDNESHLTLCTFVLRYCNNTKSIFRELYRITRPGGYIFTEEFAFQKIPGRRKIGYIFDQREIAVSFYDSGRRLQYNSMPPGREYAKEQLFINLEPELTKDLPESN